MSGGRAHNADRRRKKTTRVTQHDECVPVTILDLQDLDLALLLEFVELIAHPTHLRYGEADHTSAQIVLQLVGFARSDLQVLVADKLCPAKAEGAVAVADLTGTGEKQHGFAVFVLQTFDDFAVQHRNVVLQLAGRVRVEFAANIADQGFELAILTLCRQACICTYGIISSARAW